LLFYKNDGVLAGATAFPDFLGKQSFLPAILVREIASSAEKAFSQ